MRKTGETHLCVDKDLKPQMSQSQKGELSFCGIFVACVSKTKSEFGTYWNPSEKD